MAGYAARLGKYPDEIKDRNFTSSMTRAILATQTGAFRARFLVVLLMRERIGAELEFDDERARIGFRRGAGSAGGGRVDRLDVEWRAVARGRPQFAAFPAGLRVVDAAFESLREKAHRIRNPQLDHLSADQRVQRVRLVAGRDRHIGAQSQDVVLVNPDVIGVLLGAGIALKAGPWDCIEGKALGTFPAFLGAGTIERPPALAAVEARDMTAVERDPHDAIAVDVHAADAVAWQRDLVELGQRRVGRVRTKREPDD